MTGIYERQKHGKFFHTNFRIGTRAGDLNHGWTPTCRDEREHGGWTRIQMPALLTGKMPVPLQGNHFLQNEPNFSQKQSGRNWLQTGMLQRSCFAKVSVFFTQNEPNFWQG
jgi:hypothetical protein